MASVSSGGASPGQSDGSAWFAGGGPGAAGGYCRADAARGAVSQWLLLLCRSTLAANSTTNRLLIPLKLRGFDIFQIFCLHVFSLQNSQNYVGT